MHHTGFSHLKCCMTKKDSSSATCQVRTPQIPHNTQLFVTKTTWHQKTHPEAKLVYLLYQDYSLKFIKTI